MQTDVTQNLTYDAIVIGSGISGGWAAKELCELGLRTLVLERGRDVPHVTGYPTAGLDPWDLDHSLLNTEQDKAESPIQSNWFDPATKHFFVKDIDHPYVQSSPFHWIRGYQVGGRSLIWGRQCYRLSEMDLKANQQDGFGVDWPIRYADIAPWYDHVEKFAGISGQKEGLPQLPDGEFLPPMKMTCLEEHFAKEMKEKFDRCVTMGRMANLTQSVHGRGPCQNRNLCNRGCPYGGYFSSNSATIPAAMATGNLTLRPFSIASEIIYDKDKRRATGVRIIDQETKEAREFFAPLIFLNASTIATTAVLLRSTSTEFPNGLGNSSDQLGRNLMDHHGYVGAAARYDGFQDKYYKGRRPGSIYIPRFRNLDGQEAQSDYIRGFAYQTNSGRDNWWDIAHGTKGFGKAFKEQMTLPGDWRMQVTGFGETLPDANNRITLDQDHVDQWGMPLVRVAFEYGSNELAMRKDMRESAEEMLEAAGFSDIQGYDKKPVGGDCIHEMGTARMGRDPQTSVLNEWNQMHDVPNVYITDGSCMTSSACQNPSLTYMALTARACHHAVDQLKKGLL